MKGILGYTEDDVVSTDFLGDNRFVHSISQIFFTKIFFFFLILN